MKIAVVGLGIAGLSICARLAADGHDVDGFDQFEPMHAKGSSHGDTRIIRLTPGEGEIYVRLAEDALRGWRDWERAHAASLIDWTGGWMTGPPDSAFITSCIALARARGREPKILDGAQAVQASNGALRLPEDWIVCVQPDCGVVRADDARAFLLKSNARLHWNANVAAPITSPRLVIDGEAHDFDAVIVAAGPWIARLVPELAPNLSVERRVVAWFRPRTPAPLPVICAANEEGLFGMPTPDGLYKIGLHTLGPRVDPDRVEEPNSADARRLAASIETFLPACEPAPLRLARCLYTITPDENFIVRSARMHERVLLFSCCSGHGFKYAPAFGDIAADWLAGRASEALTAFGETRRAPPAAALGEG